MRNGPSGYLKERYSEKGGSYFAKARHDYVLELDTNPQAAILELGCGNGANGALALRERKCGSYVGIEMFEPAALEARGVLTNVHIGNVESIELPYAAGSFDALICSEVIEHLTDPRPTLRRLVALLRPGGRVFASVPNISHWRIVFRLVAGEFNYEEEGAMDQTHLRWFTPNSFKRLFEECGVAVDRVKPIGAAYARVPWAYYLPLGHLLWYQIDLRGHRA